MRSPEQISITHLIFFLEVPMHVVKYVRNYQYICPHKQQKTCSYSIYMQDPLIVFGILYNK